MKLKDLFKIFRPIKMLFLRNTLEESEVESESNEGGGSTENNPDTEINEGMEAAENAVASTIHSIEDDPEREKREAELKIQAQPYLPQLETRNPDPIALFKALKPGSGSKLFEGIPVNNELKNKIVREYLGQRSDCEILEMQPGEEANLPFKLKIRVFMKDAQGNILLTPDGAQMKFVGSCQARVMSDGKINLFLEAGHFRINLKSENTFSGLNNAFKMPMVWGK